MHAFFISRPVFASVIGIIISLAGAISLVLLPIEWYPNLALPQVVVSSTYVGASAEVVETTVTAPLEESINGVEGMRYIESNSSNDGISTITVTFERERDLDIAAVDVQNRVSTVLGRLPAEVRAIGVDVRRASNAIVLGMGVYATDGQYDDVFISNYVDRYIRDELRRVNGVGDVRIFGERKYAMRLWIDPLKLAANSISASGVTQALREQNIQVAAGQIGRPPAPDNQTLQVALTANGRFTEVDDFMDMVVRTDTDGGLLRFRDIGTVELGAENYNASVRFNQKNAVGIGIYQLPSANALDVERDIKQRMEDLSVSFPPGLEYKVAFNPTTIVRESIDEVLFTLLGTIALVIAVIFVFLQRWQTTLIPALTIPISLLGTFIFVRAFGFSINTLTLFGLTLATGLVVDDSIVVVENIERLSRERGLDRRQASLAGTGEVFGAVIATSLVLVSVFMPAAFFPGTTGVLYQQFALTISFSIALSSFTALTLAPALAAILLQTGSDGGEGRIFGAFNRGFDRLRDAYERVLTTTLKGPTVATLAFVGLLAAAAFLGSRMPTGFVPSEDQGYLITVVIAPPGMALTETSRVSDQVTEIMHNDPDIENTFAIRGFSFDGTAANRATIFSPLKDREHRQGGEHLAPAVAKRLQGKLAGIPDAIVVVFEPPPIRGIGNLGGFEFQLQDRGNLGLGALEGEARTLIGRAQEDPTLTGMLTSFSTGDPQLNVILDRERTRALDIPIDQAFDTLQVSVGSVYVNDFTFLNRSYRVYVQARGTSRSSPNDINALYVPSAQGRPVPLGELIDLEESSGPQIIKHFNLFRTATINGGPTPGRSSGDAIAAMSRLAGNLPPGMDYEWSGLALEQNQAGNVTFILFGLGILLTFLILAAQYESFSLPVVIMLSAPMGIFGAFAGLASRGLVNDAFALTVNDATGPVPNVSTGGTASNQDDLSITVTFTDATGIDP
ncbi:MAG: efflux RND transporter permease subunit, partial [Myxococcota bacterium]